jgi:DNA-binding Lrp family transcriptional regulator
MPALTPHERQFLTALLENGVASNTDIAKQMGLSPTAVRKIRMKLEGNGIIRGYRPVLDLPVMGIQVFTLLELRILPKGWAEERGASIQGHLVRHENVIAVYRLPEGQATHAVVAGFRNQEEVDRFLHVLQSQYSELLEIRHCYTFSTKSVLKDNPQGILTKVLLEWNEAKLPSGLTGMPVRVPVQAESAEEGRET